MVVAWIQMAVIHNAQPVATIVMVAVAQLRLARRQSLRQGKNQQRHRQGGVPRLETGSPSIREIARFVLFKAVIVHAPKATDALGPAVGSIV